MRVKASTKILPSSRVTSTTRTKPPRSKKKQDRPNFIIEPTPQWYATEIATLPKTASPPNADTLGTLSLRATTLHAADTELFLQKHNTASGSGDASFLQRVLHEGTLSDRLGALTLLVQGSPVHNVRALESLRSLATRGRGTGGRGDALRALRCIVDWWVGGGAPSRKLRYFREQPLDDPAVTDQHLVLWHFEDWLKKYYFSILQLLETLCLDPLAYVRTQALTFVFTLLRDKPEQEQNLLRLLVNKLGDVEKSICSRASYYLLQLLQVHPAMKAVVVREMTALILRPSTTLTSSASHPAPAPAAGSSKHIRFPDDSTTPAKSKSQPKKSKDASKKSSAVGNSHARYYASITFNQIVLTPGDREVALQLMDIYFEMFREMLGMQPFGKESEGGGGEPSNDKELRMDKKGRVVDKGKRSNGTVGDVRGEAGFVEVEDTHSKLISAILTGINRAVPFAKIDANDARLNKHIDTLFLITHKSTFNISLQALVLIQHISTSLSASPSAANTSKSVTDRYYRALYASLHDSRLATSAKQAMYLNLLFKSIKSDPDASGERAKALVRRFVQLLVSGGNGATEFVAGGLFLLGELFSTVPGLRDVLRSAKDRGNADENYDPRKRDPQYAHASSSPLWELTILRHHYHPTISLYARQLLSSQPLTASADLSLNTLSHFLDRFVYKNPKKATKGDGEITSGGKARGTSAMQPAATAVDGTGVKLLKGDVEDAEAVHGEVFLKRRLQDVPVDQAFFHRYFTKKKEMEKANIRQSGTANADDDEVNVEEDAEDESDAGDEDCEASDGSDDVEAEIWKAMKSTLPSAGEDPDLLDDDEIGSDGDEDEPSLGSHSDDEIDLAEGSDDEDLISQGDYGLIEYDGLSLNESDAEDEWGGVDDAVGEKKRKRKEDNDRRRSARKKLKSLPTFASYEDYAAMIDADGEDSGS